MFFSSGWLANRPWQERIKAAWVLLRGREYFFADVILAPKQVQELKDYVNKL